MHSTFCHLTSGSAALMRAVICCLVSTNQPHACCRFSPRFPNCLPQNEEWNFQKSLEATCFHLVEPSGYRNLISLQPDRGSEVLAAAGVVTAEVAVPCSGSYGCLELPRCGWPLKDVCEVPVPASIHQCQAVLTAVLPNQAGSAAAQASFLML